ncbi:MAG: molybdenum cofactor guanylyltransferase [Pseudoalteromonas sp.]
MAVTGLVLAGGKSSRMNTDKADLFFFDKTFQLHSVDLLTSVGVDEVLISRNENNLSIEHIQGSDIGSTYLKNTDIKGGYLKDVYPNAGPLGGIYSALKQTSNDLLVAAVDMPLVNKPLLEELLSFFKSHKNKCHAQNKALNLVHYRDFPLPIYIKNNMLTRDYLHSILTTANSNRSIKQFIKACDGLALEQLESNQIQALSNINTPAQYDALCKAHGINKFKKEVISHD